MIKSIVNPLSLAFWNVDALFTRTTGQRSCKLQDNGFLQVINKYDIIGFVETHCGTKDTLTLENYKIYQNNRPVSSNGRHYGGIAIGIKHAIRKGVKIVPTTNTEISWMKLSKTFFNLNRDLYIAIVYVSPRTSSYSVKRDDLFEVLEKDTSFYSKEGDCLICGDFNARTTSEPDFCIENIKLQHLSLPYDYVCDTFIRRNNMDKTEVDPHGKELLSYCRTSGLRILNGRTLGDSAGHYTCYSPNGAPSTIDYILSTESLRRNIEYFHVHSPSEYSIHCMLSVSITAHFKGKTEQSSLYPLPDKYIWDSTSTFKYQQAIISPEIQAEIHNFLNNKSHTVTVDEALNSVNNIISNTAKVANIKTYKARSVKKKRRPRKTWFNEDCAALHKELKKTSNKLHNNPEDMNTLHYYHRIRRKYRKLLKKSKTEFRNKILNKMENLNSSNPQAFWNLYYQMIDFDHKTKVNPIPPDEWVNHFSNLLISTNNIVNSEFEQTMEDYVNSNIDSTFNELNFKISHTEISKAINSLKPGKSCGLDMICNEMIKAGATSLLPVLHKLFNHILTLGNFPSPWQYNTLTPIHKKGDVNDTNNYRGIALSSCLSKLLCIVLHNRLIKHTTKNDLIPLNQIGYMKDSRTSDHVLTLKTIIDKYINKINKGKLFACFVDFGKAFDTISRTSLLYKLVKVGIGGNFLKLVKSIYSNVSFCIKLPNGITKPISSNIGVKQGCVLSPMFFNLFVRDLPDIFDATCCPVNIHDTSLSCLMFADDLVLLSESPTGLQNCLNKLYHYCSKWNLRVNLKKTKVVIFNKTGKLLKSFQFHYNNKLVDIDKSYCYLGIIFTCSGSFTEAIEHLCNQAQKALFKLKQKGELLSHIKTAFKLFDTLILPILGYCAEIWLPYFCKELTEGKLYNLCDKLHIEKLHLKFCKYLLGVHRKATNTAVRAELGRYPLLITFLGHAIKYWLTLCNSKKPSFVKTAYLDLYNTMDYFSNWASSIKTILVLSNMPEVWLNQGSLYRHKIVKLIKKTYSDKYLILWLEDMNSDDSKLRTYRSFKSNIAVENYLLSTNDVHSRREFTKLRISAHQLHIETGRYTRPRKTPLDERICHYCNGGHIESEQHFILSCSFYLDERNSFFSNLNSFSNFDSLTDQEKFSFIMSYNLGDTEVLTHTLHFINACLRKRSMKSPSVLLG